MTCNSITCSLCQRETPIKIAERHHLIPRLLTKRNKYAKLPQVANDDNTIDVCFCCADQLHQLFTLKELAESYNTLEKLLANELVQKWINWIKNKPITFEACMKSKKRRG